MNTFKGQDNDAIANLCAHNNCTVVIVPHNLTNKFQPLRLISLLNVLLVKSTANGLQSKPQTS